jgi:hypothetical protein
MKDEESISSDLTVNSVFNYSFVSLILQQQKKLNLSTEQIEKLKKLQSEFRKETLKGNAELQVAEIELNELQTQDPLDLEKVDAKLKQIETFRTELRLAYIKTIEQGKAVLTSEQQKNLESFERTALPALVYPDQEYFSESNLRQQIQTALKEQFKDQKVVEIETAEAIATRVSNWTKLLGFFVGIPVAFLVFVLGFLGIKTYDDLRTYVQKSEVLKSQYESLASNLKNIDTLKNEVEILAKKVDKIDQFVFSTPELQNQLQSQLDAFQKYFQNLGYKVKGSSISVETSPDTEQPNAYYDPINNRIVIHKSLLSDTDVALKPYTHHVLITLVPNGYKDIESGLGDYFVCSFTNDPILGEMSAKKVFKIEQGYMRNLDNNLKFTNLRADADRWSRGEIWGGAFWEIRQLLKPEVADRLLFSTWKTMASSENLNDRGENFVRNLLEQAKSVEGGKYNDQIRSIFESRGLKL